MADNKVAVITGSATGVGAATARQLAAKGWNVAINYSRSEDDARATAAACEKLGAETIVSKVDVREDADCRRFVDEAVGKWGRLDALVNSAGWTSFTNHADLEALTSEAFERTLMVNVLGPYQMVRAAEPHLRAAGQASVVNVSSIGGITSSGSSHAYAASKAALNSLTRSLARVMGPEIRVNAVCPGFIEGRWLEDAMGKERLDTFREVYKGSSPLARTATPDDVAHYILFFIEDAPLTTGEVLMLDAGFTLGKPSQHAALGTRNR